MEKAVSRTVSQSCMMSCIVFCFALFALFRGNSSCCRLDKILEQLQTDLLAFLRMELRGKHVLLPNRRGEAFAVSRARRDDRWVNRFGKEAVHEINVTAGRNVTQNRTIRSNHLDLVPANLRDLQSRLLGKT